MGDYGFMDLGHTEKLEVALSAQEHLADLQAKYAAAANTVCTCGCGATMLTHDSLCPPWTHLSGDHPSALDKKQVQEWWPQVLPHVTKMAKDISDAYGVPVDMVLSPNLGTDADYVFQPHPDYGGYEVVGPPSLTEFAKGAGPTIGIVGYPALTKKKQPMSATYSVLGKAQPVVVTPKAQHSIVDSKVYIAPKDPELPDWVQKSVIASQVKHTAEPTIKASWDGEHWEVLDNPTGAPIDGALLDGMFSMAKPGVYWVLASAVAKAILNKLPTSGYATGGLIMPKQGGKASCICITAGPDMDGPDIDCPVHGLEAWESQQEPTPAFYCTWHAAPVTPSDPHPTCEADGWLIPA